MTTLSLILHEARALLRLTGPLLLAQLAQTAMGFVDTVMAGRYSAVDLAAVAVGFSIFIPVYVFLLGLLSAVTPLVAQAHGRGDGKAVRRAIRLGMGIGLAAGLLLMPLLWWTDPVHGVDGGKPRGDPDHRPLPVRHLLGPAAGRNLFRPQGRRRWPGPAPVVDVRPVSSVWASTLSPTTC
jgi:Na+-driven multidrug efflux pump